MDTVTSTRSLAAASGAFALLSGALIVLCSALPLARGEVALLCTIAAGLGVLSLVYYACALLRAARTPAASRAERGRPA